MNLARLIAVSLFIFSISSAQARMYQWVDPVSKTTRFSGKPPVWYRSVEGGPRVLVFEGNRIIDDTNISVSDVERDHLRQESFLRAEEDREKAREKLLQAKRLEAVSGQKDGDEATPAVLPELMTGTEEVQKAATAPVTEEAVVNEMRMLIQEWENQRSESARALIESGPALPPGQ